MWRYVTGAKPPSKKKKKSKNRRRKEGGKKKYDTTQRERHFQIKWLGQFKWLRYDATSKKTMYCKTCREFTTASAFDNHFYERTNNCKTDSVKKHEGSSPHKTACLKDYTVNSPTDTPTARSLPAASAEAERGISTKKRTKATGEQILATNI